MTMTNSQPAARTDGHTDYRTDNSTDNRTDNRTERRTFTETKLGAKTSEFYFAIIAIAGILIATYIASEDSLSREDGWRMASFVAIAYIISRGLAKLGTREPYTDDRD